MVAKDKPINLKWKLWTILGLLVLSWCSSTICVSAAEALNSDDSEGGGCYTQIMYDLKYGHLKDAMACTPRGPCDDPGERNLWVPDSTDPINVIQLYFHVFAEDNGSNPAATPEHVQMAVDDINAHYLPARIQFEYEMRTINSSQFRYLTAGSEFSAMKSLYALAPDSQLNIWVASVNVNGSVYSYGTFPWDGAALTNYGGIVMNQTQFPPYGRTTLTHEIGHNVGLWHTHHGVSEVGQCGSCYESPGTAGRDYLGDLCSDTDPTPTSYACGGPGGYDYCSGDAWGETDWRNHMGYGGCRSEFSIQQTGRINCWLDDILYGWLSNVHMSADTVFGEVPLAVQFTGTTPKNVLTWDWSFGDGGGSAEQDPAHNYDEPGYFDVGVTIDTDDGVYETNRQGYISVYADTIIGGTVTGAPGEQVKVDVYAHNYLPLEVVTIPISWAGPLDLDLDSASVVGLRTEAAEVFQKIHSDSWVSRATYQIIASPSGLGADIAPDTGAIMSLYFSIPWVVPDESNPIEILSYSSYVPRFTARAGVYDPVTVAGQVDLCSAGDVNNDGEGPNVADLTYLVDYLFTGGPPPPISGAGDVDGSEGFPNIADLTYLVAHLFLGGPPPVC